MSGNRRRTDPLSTAAFVISIITALVVAINGFPAVLSNRSDIDRVEKLATQITREGRERRDQTCRLFERDHLQDVQRLRGTYDYLSDLPRGERHTFLTQVVVGGLGELEDEARVDTAPEFCDEPGVKAERLYQRTHGKRGAPPIGLPEPDPVLPERRSFKHLLHP